MTTFFKEVTEEQIAINWLQANGLYAIEMALGQNLQAKANENDKREIVLDIRSWTLRPNNSVAFKERSTEPKQKYTVGPVQAVG